MHIVAYETETAFDVLREEWNALVARSGHNTVFATWEWQKHWWDAYGSGAPLWVLTVRDAADVLRGLAPFFVEQREGVGRVLRLVGSEDVTDYLDVIVDRDYAQPVYEAILAYLKQERARYDLIDLANVPEQSLTLNCLVSLAQARGFTVVITQQEVCPTIQLPTTFEAYVAQLDGKHGHELRRKLRKAEAFDGIAWYIVRTQEELPQALNTFFHLMASSKAYKEGFLQDTRHTQFFQAMASAMLARGWLQLAFLTVDDEAVATYFNLDYGNRILVYNSGLLQDKYGALSAGIVLLAHLIRHAIEAGREVFDFLRGNEPYKYHMGGKDTVVYNVQLYSA